MKNILYLLMMICLFAIPHDSAKAQSTVHGVQANFPKPKDSKILKEFENETEWSNAFDSPNKLELVHGANIRNRTTAVLEVKRFTVRLSGELVVPTKFDPDNTLTTFSIGVSKNFHKFDLELNNSFFFRHRKKLGILETKISKTLTPAEEVFIKPFAAFSGVYSLDGINNNVSNGVFARTGLEFEGKLSNGYLAIRSQMILDRGSLQKGNRVAGNIEIHYLFRARKTYFGPKVEYTNFLYSNHQSHLEKRNIIGFGFIFKIK